MGGPSAEHAISLKSGTTMAQSLDQTRYDVIPVIIDEHRRWLTAPNLLRSGKSQRTSKALIPAEEYQAGRLDVALLALHSYGEDGMLQGFLETLGIPYSGSGILASSVAMDKARFKLFCRGLGVRVLPDYVVTKSDWRNHPQQARRAIQKLGQKVVVKPNQSGSSAGVSIISLKDSRSLATAITAAFRADSQSLIVEPFLKGREFTVATLGDDQHARALPVIEIVPTADSFFSYKVKYDGTTKEICPARISTALTKKLSAIALEIHHGLGASGVLRTDFIVRGATPYVLETNTLPGMTTESLVPKAARAAGMSYSQLLTTLIELALKRRA